MADNVSITPGSGASIAADEVSDGTLGNVKVQYVKIMDGTLDGTNKAAVGSNGLKVDGSAVTQPVSAASLPLPSGAATAAKQPALGTAGTASSDVITMQGVSGMTPVLIDGAIAAGSIDSKKPVKTGGYAGTAYQTAVSNGQIVNAMYDIYGNQVTIGALREMKGVQTTTITSSTSETTIVTADASYKLDIYHLVIANTSASACEVTIKDATSGTTREIFYVPAGDTRGFSLPVDSAIPQNAANNNWTATCGSSVASIKISAHYVKHP